MLAHCTVLPSPISSARRGTGEGGGGSGWRRRRLEAGGPKGWEASRGRGSREMHESALACGPLHHPRPCPRPCPHGAPARDAVVAAGPGVDHPVEPIQLIVTQGAACGGRWGARGRRHRCEGGRWAAGAEDWRGTAGPVRQCPALPVARPARLACRAPPRRRTLEEVGLLGEGARAALGKHAALRLHRLAALQDAALAVLRPGDARGRAGRAVGAAQGCAGLCSLGLAPRRRPAPPCACAATSPACRPGPAAHLELADVAPLPHRVQLRRRLIGGLAVRQALPPAGQGRAGQGRGRGREERGEGQQRDNSVLATPNFPLSTPYPGLPTAHTPSSHPSLTCTGT